MTASDISSAILEAASITLVTEIGDKTFFVTAILASKFSKFHVCLGSIAALWLQTLFCVCLGVILTRVPASMKNSPIFRWPIQDYLAGIVLLICGIINITEALTNNDSDEELPLNEPLREDTRKPRSVKSESLAEAHIVSRF